jgi:lipopolysaccharide exporter
VRSKAAAPGGSLAPHAARGAAALAAATMATHVLALATSVFLARHLVPADFGVVAAANLVLAFIGPLYDSGLGTAFVARAERPRDYAPTLVWSASASGIIVAVLAALAAPLVAQAFAQPSLVDVMRLLALGFVLRGLAAAPLAILAKELAFVPRAVKTAAGGAAESATGVGLALAGFGVWSLVWGQLAGAAASAIVAWIFVPWRPWGRFSAARLVEMSRFGRHVVAANTLGFLGSYLDNLVVGRVLGMGALGLYGAAFRWGRLPVTALAGVAGPVAFPTYVAVRADAERLRRAYLRLVRTLTTLTMPAQVGLFLVAGELVTALYPPAWNGMIGPLRVFALFGLVNSVVGTTGDVLKATNRPGWISGLALLHVPVLVLGLWLLVDRGPSGAALALTLAALASGAVALRVALDALGLGAARFAAALAPQAMASGIMAVAIAVARPLVADVAPMTAFIVLTGLGAAVYATVLAAIDYAWVRESAMTMRTALLARAAAPPPNRRS